MSERSTAGAVVAAAYYMTSLYPYAYVSGNLDEIRAMSDAACSFCNGVISDVEEIVRLDQTDSGASVSLQGSRAGDPSADGSMASVWLTINQGTSERRDVNGILISRDPGGVYVLFLVLEWRDRWVVRAIDADEPQ